MMTKQIAFIADDQEHGTSTIEYDDGSKEISGPNGTTHVPAPKPNTGAQEDSPST